MAEFDLTKITVKELAALQEKNYLDDEVKIKLAEVAGVDVATMTLEEYYQMFREFLQAAYNPFGRKT